MIRTQNGNCVCPRGTELKNGACRKVEQPPVRQCKLLPGMIRTQSGKCVCPRGTELSNGQCRKPKLECPRGTHPQKGTCVPDAGKVCPTGTSASSRTAAFTSGPGLASSTPARS